MGIDLVGVDLEKSGEGLGSQLRHRLEMVDSVSNVDLVCTNRVHHFRSVT